jgi:acyl carrier protein
MTDAEIRALILELICEIAPEADPAAVRDQDDIRDVFDLDSMDFTNLIVAIHERVKVNIPEADYNKLFTLEKAIAYLRESLARSE